MRLHEDYCVSLLVDYAHHAFGSTASKQLIFRSHTPPQYANGPCHALWQVRGQIMKGSKIKKALANSFLAASTAYVHAKRIVDGVALQYARTPRPFFALVMAVLTSTVLYPVHRSGAAWFLLSQETRICCICGISAHQGADADL